MSKKSLDLCTVPFPDPTAPLLMRLASTFCDVLRTNFIVGLRLFPELAEDPADAGCEIS